MFMRSLLTGTALLSLAALPAFAADQAPAAKPATTVSQTVTTNSVKPAAKTEAVKPAIKTASAEKASVKSAHKHRVAMHKSAKKVAKADTASKSGKPAN